MELIVEVLIILWGLSREEKEIYTLAWGGCNSIKGFSAAGSESSDLVLKGITLDICPGEKPGICGRSGSGKSSLLASFFHLLECREAFIAIDDQYLALLSRDLHRQRLNCIIQDPCWLGRESVLNTLSVTRKQLQH
jgi:ATP-binding cassette, subfamily C (CFTR/MRP), member 1